MTVGDDLRQLVARGELELPLPASGSTPERHRRLLELARRDLPLARLAEAHVDAVSILREAGRAPVPAALYGVWASEDPSTELHLERRASSGSTLQGAKGFCTGAGIVDRALITVPSSGGPPLLVDVDVRPSATVEHDGRGWITPAFETTGTAVCTFRGEAINADAVIGETGWYLDRPGFWHGACGPAACWAGGAIGLVDTAQASAVARDANPHRDAHLGAITALAWSMSTALEQAGREIDAAPGDREAAMRRALIVRHLVERGCVELLDRFGRMAGPRPFAFDAAASRRIAEVQLYVRQCHAERDLEALGTALREQANPMDGRQPGRG